MSLQIISFPFIDSAFPELRAFTYDLHMGHPRVKEMMKLESYKDRVEMCRKIIEDNRIRVEVKSGGQKSEVEALKLKQEGNHHYKAKDYGKALLFYNKALAHAPKKSTLLGILYANRSTIYIRNQMYAEALQNIDLAQQHGYEKLDVLEERRQICARRIENPAKQAPIFDESWTKLDGQSHEMNPFLAKCVEFRVDQKQGVHMVTTAKMKPGEIFLLQEAFTWTIEGDYKYCRCLGCLKIHNLNLSVPCDGCTRALFCSERCKEEANRQFHRFDCRLMEKLENSSCFQYVLATRNSLMALSLFDDLNELDRTMKEIDANPMSALEQDFRGPANRKQLWKVLYAARFQDEKQPLSNKFEDALGAAMAYELLMSNSSLGKTLKTNTDRHLFMCLLLHFLSTNSIHTNPLEPVQSGRIMIMKDPSQEEKLPAEGYACFPFTAFFRHSCMPNVSHLDVGRDRERLIHYTQRPISSGSALTKTYCSECQYIQRTKEQRDKCLLSCHNIACDCVACVNDYQPLNDLDWMIIRFSTQLANRLSIRDNESKEDFKKEAEKNARQLSHLEDDQELDKDTVMAQQSLMYQLAGIHWNGNLFRR